MEACVVAFCTGLPDKTFNNRYGEHLSQQGAVGPTAWVTKLSEGGDNTTPEKHSKTVGLAHVKMAKLHHFARS